MTETKKVKVKLTEEEKQQRKIEQAERAKAERERRKALTPEQRKIEDEQKKKEKAEKDRILAMKLIAASEKADKRKEQADEKARQNRFKATLIAVDQQMLKHEDFVSAFWKEIKSRLGSLESYGVHNDLMVLQSIVKVLNLKNIEVSKKTSKKKSNG